MMNLFNESNFLEIMKNNASKWILAIIVLLGSATLNAQENGNRDSNGKIVRGPYQTNRMFDNIFIGIGGGVNIYNGENDTYGKFKQRLAPALDLYVGKWFTPSVGVRLGYSGIKANGWTTGLTDYAKRLVAGNIYDEKFGVMYFHGDFMWNFSNAVSGYKETRTWNFVPFIGAGWARSYGNSHRNNEFAVSVGLLNNIRLCDLLDLTIEARHMFVNQRFDGVVFGSRAEGMTSVTLGLSFKLNKRSFKRVAPAVVPDYSSYEKRINALQQNNEQLAAQNKNLTDENEQLKNRKVEPTIVSKVSVTPVALFFTIGSATLNQKELANLDFYVKNAMKVDKNRRFTLTGSADNTTGSEEMNQRLSEQRLQYVYDLLVNKYGIPSDRLIKKAEGDTNNRFDEPELNRVVIIE